MLLADEVAIEQKRGYWAGVPYESGTIINNVEFITLMWGGTTITRFTSKSENAKDVLQAVAQFCEGLGVGGPTDFRMKFNTATCPGDYVRGEIEWVGY